MQLAETASTVYSLENGILTSVVKAGHKMTILDAAENLETRRTLDISFPIPFLMDIREMPDITLEAIIATGNQPDRDNYSAAALLVTEPVHDLIARESKRFKKHNVPYKIFRDREKAINWLNEYKS